MEVPVSPLPAEGGIRADDPQKPAEEGGEEPESLPAKQFNPEYLVARAIVPVKTEYLRPPPQRPSSNSGARNHGGGVPADGDQEKAAPSSAPVVVKEKKSKRQLKRERQQDQKSAKNICPEIAKTGDVGACRFGGGCRFSHDLDGFLAQKQADIPGVCPFLNDGQPCPYGVACRFACTHKELVTSTSSDDAPKKSKVEINSLNKDLQKLLWKNKVKFPKADAQLELLGLLGGKNTKVKAEEVTEEKDHPPVSKGSSICDDDSNRATCHSVDDVKRHPDVCSDNDNLNDASVVDVPRPPKKSKGPIDESCCSTEVSNGLEEKSLQTEEKEMLPNACPGSRVELISKLNDREKKLIDFRGKLYLAPLTTVGNLPFRRVCKVLGADVTCGEMAMCTNILQGQASEWALLRRHSYEDIFGVQICGSYPDTVARTVELINRECTVDFIDINMGCPIDIVVNKGAGSSLLTKPSRMKNIIQAASGIVDIPLTVKVRTGYFEGRNRIDSLIADISQWGSSAITIHGRSRQQRYSKLADWDYIYQCARKATNDLQVFGNGDIFSYLDWNKHTSDCPELSSCMIARGALIKPWIFTEIKEQRHWDISSGERFDILKKFVNFGLQHWGSDNKGVETTRYFLLEWLSYTHRYVPVGLLDVVPQRLNWRPPSYFGRNDLETLMASDSAADWIRISEMLLCKVPDGFTFAPKHKSNAYDRAENG